MEDTSVECILNSSKRWRRLWARSAAGSGGRSIETLEVVCKRYTRSAAHEKVFDVVFSPSSGQSGSQELSWSPVALYLSRSCQWWWRNSQSVARERNADTSESKNQAPGGAVHLSIGMELLNHWDSDDFMIFWSVVTILGFNFFFFPKFVQIFFTQGATSPSHISLNIPRTPWGYVSKAAAKQFELLSDACFRELLDPALEIRSRTNSRNRFSHSSCMLDSLSVIRRGMECSHSLTTLPSVNILNACKTNVEIEWDQTR